MTFQGPFQFYEIGRSPCIIIQGCVRCSCLWGGAEGTCQGVAIFFPFQKGPRSPHQSPQPCVGTGLAHRRRQDDVGFWGLTLSGHMSHGLPVSM